MPIFTPFRALGYVTEAVPFSIQRRGRETFVTVSVGHAWQIFNCEKLSLVFVGPQLPKKIRALVSSADLTFAANGHCISVFKRAHQVATWRGHVGKVLLLLPFGGHLISVGSDGRVFLWPISTAPTDMDRTEKGGDMQLGESFTPTCICHPETYLNKVLIGSEEGSLQLWNVRSRQLIHEFPGWGSPVRCCVSSPALDTVGVGCSDGHVHVHNIKYDQTVVSFRHAEGAAVTALSFRTDGQPFLATGGATGVVSLWNLEKRKLQAVIKDAHDEAVVSLYFFPREPVLLSSGRDNALKMWIFDSDDGEARLLRFRSGHSAPPACIRYYGQGLHLLSAGQDRAFRVFSTIQDQQSRELSQGHAQRRAKKLKIKVEEVKLPRVVAFAAAEIRERDWCNVVTCHEDDISAYIWRLQDFVIGEHVLTLTGGEQSAITACAISACGSLAILGTANGRMERFNLQSGAPRGPFQVSKRQYSPAHQGAVVAIECDGTNASVFSAGYDGAIKVWDFRRRKLKGRMDVGTPITKMAFHRGNGLLAVASADCTIRVFDAVSSLLVRRFQAHTDRITDMCISEDGRWLVSASMDQSIRTWDLVAARQLDCIFSDVAVTGLTLSPGMDMLATIHVNRRGIYLWANKLMYAGLEDADIFGSHNQGEKVALPTISSGLVGARMLGGGEEEGEDEQRQREVIETGDVQERSRMREAEARRSQNGVGGALALAAESADRELKEAQGAAVAKASEEAKERLKPLLPEMVTLALLPRSQWQNLIHLDVIKERNKPIAPPEKPQQAPFFLPTLPSLSGTPVFAPSTPGQDGDDEDEEARRDSARRAATKVKRKSGREAFRSDFSRLLHAGAESGDYAPLLALLRSMSPSAIDLELRMMEVMMGPEEEDEGEQFEPEEVEEVGLLLDFLVAATRERNNFELVQAVMHRALTIHGEALSRFPRLQAKAAELLHEQKGAWEKVDSLFQGVRCMVAFLTNSTN
eukprot:TRINITY_DN5414_c0_g1_i1.p1 TRINITY_DN5414_c0_g1~~TRINITY_DN5414_c0_g1_i1.p1  ORF type:complete len:979 (-),score=218.28 TRINITY_DN5414_c0_g1_i1:1298-4234(-)